ncbi:hypothetical protein A3Q56_01885 [Intoshia linei]|uniref:Uncharacterized protein n=1 Tax=Intoshia linei TaxID=1819745 RepID=A0A177B9D2_9BILA|nr:hypothetical protein A3Q56_01885 [Intoshia linei]
MLIIFSLNTDFMKLIIDDEIPKTVDELLILLNQLNGIKEKRHVKSIVKSAFTDKCNIDELTIKFVLNCLKKENFNMYSSIVHLSTSINKLEKLLNSNHPRQKES